MKVLAALAVLSAGTALAQIAYNPVPPLTRIHSLYNPTMTDQLLTQYANEASWLQSSGWGSATGDVIYLESRPQLTTVPLYRLYKGPPQNEHFFTTIQADVGTLVAQYGYADEGIVGHIYKEQVPGSVPLYRLTRYDGNTGDLVHRYTLSSSVVSTLQAQGFNYEGITGYVYKTATPTVAGGHIFGVRPQPGPDYRNYAFGSYRSVSSIGTKPSGATRQVMRFKFWSPDMFATPSAPSVGDHLLFVPRGTLQVNTSNLLAGTIHGIGLIITAGNYGCPLYDGAFIEEWWPVPSAPPNAPAWGGYNFLPGSPPDTCGLNPLKNRIWYDVYVAVNDSGQASYTIRQNGVVIATHSVTYGTAALTPTGVDPDAGAGTFNTAARGWFMTNAQGASRDYTAYVTELSVVWE